MKNALLLFVLLMVCCSCSRQERVDELPKRPQRIVSMAPSLTECIDAAGGVERIVGVTKFCVYPEKIAQLPRVGGFSDANFEAVYRLKPDLVIILDKTFAAPKRLDALGIPYLTLDTSTIAKIYESIRFLGTLFQTESQAESTIRDLEQQVQAIAAAAQNAPSRRVLIAIGRNMGTGGLSDVYVAGKHTLYHEMLKLLGAENVYTGDLDYAKLSIESILRLNPDVIIDLVPDLEKSIKLTPEEVQQEWNALDRVAAVKHGQVYVFAGDYVTIPGPRFTLVCKDIAQAVHPEIFGKVSQ